MANEQQVLEYYQKGIMTRFTAFCYLAFTFHYPMIKIAKELKLTQLIGMH